MLARDVVLSLRSPIGGVKRRRPFRCTPAPRRCGLSCSSSSLHLEASLTYGEPHAIVAAFLQSAQREKCGALQRVLRCDVSRDALLCACVGMVTPSGLWPPFVAERLKLPREGRDTELTATSWRAFAFALVRCIHAAQGHGRTTSALAPLCATCLAPSLQLGERLAGLLSASLGKLPTSITTSAATAALTAADVATAFATCCSLSKVETVRSDAAWLRLWSGMQARPGNALNPAWVRCQELHLSCLFRAGRREEIEAVLQKSTETLLMMRRMSDATLAELFLMEPLSPMMRSQILAALLEVSRVKGEAASALFHTLSPFERGRMLPSVTRSSILFAKALRCLVLQARDEPSVANYTRVLHDIQGLCQVSNSYALAASLVPHDSPLASLMTASLDEQRARLLATFVGAVAEATELACDFARRADSGSGSGTHDDCVEATLRGCVKVLTGLLTLCSSRRGKLPQRRAEPEWRKRLHRDAAVRSHKYELLCCELPHALLSRCLSMLLCNGFVCSGADLGGCLVPADFVDLHFYALSLLGSLYQAVRVAQQQPDVLPMIRALYHRRREVFGEDVSLRTQYDPGAASSDSSPVLCDAAVVQYRVGDAAAETTLGFLHARSTVAAGGPLVIDSSFGVWLWKASARVVWY
ncbi:hypothetical protein TraAM80_03496 [Trypanosoma rangeli]|uniref:Uncharacterized protein n=1 Tax=Trypanosoma rangeli TaxID=5698 RepID=A0A422NNR4_TRYRA|nr:uncharacterized protein TraAM80_03496 [Trypanosoma rangeli]RNF07142.1 hypothetical protein TraAM80_03496 [Trypanosoma rangeli]|eukprot:RNF07142.1 hypothetical protein TraAM80_03496 [Trypanosoma rangeli]